MGRYQYQVYERSHKPRFLAVFGLQWQILEAQVLEPAADLAGAMAAAIERLVEEGWQAESEARFGFTFVRRDTERRLLMLTPLDRYNMAQQSFNPFQAKGQAHGGTAEV